MTADRQVAFEDKTIKFQVIRSGRRKTSEITVEPMRVVVRVPSTKDTADIDRMVARKARWILEKQDVYSQMEAEVARPTFEDGSRLPYLGKTIPIKILTSKERDRVVLLKDTLVFVLGAASADKQRVRRLYESWLEEKARVLLPPIADKYSKMLGISPKKLVIKNLSGRWGSAAKDGTLNLNVNLLKAPEEVIEYIVVHEMSHLRERSHSHRFWSLVRAMMPRYEEREEWLKAHALGMVE